MFQLIKQTYLFLHMFSYQADSDHANYLGILQTSYSLNMDGNVFYHQLFNHLALALFFLISFQFPALLNVGDQTSFIFVERSAEYIYDQFLTMFECFPLSYDCPFNDWRR